MNRPQGLQRERERERERARERESKREREREVAKWPPDFLCRLASKQSKKLFSHISYILRRISKSDKKSLYLKSPILQSIFFYKSTKQNKTHYIM